MSDVTVASNDTDIVMKLLLTNSTESKEASTLKIIYDALFNVPSYELAFTPVSGATLKFIGNLLKTLDVHLSQVLPVSQAGLYRQYKKVDVDLVVKDSLVELVRLMLKGVEAFGDWEDFHEWLNARIENLGNRRPLDLLALQTGRREVEQTLERIEYGVYG